jgi:hypothetical protein
MGSALIEGRFRRCEPPFFAPLFLAISLFFTRFLYALFFSHFSSHFSYEAAHDDIRNEPHGRRTPDPERGPRLAPDARIDTRS